MDPSPSLSRLDSNVDFVIETALPEELDAVLTYLPGYRKLAPTSTDIRTYYQIDLPVTFSDTSTGNYHIIITGPLGMGRVSAAAATSDAIRRWEPRYVILLGIAGGIAIRNVKLGDILISDQVIDYELQKLTQSDAEVRWSIQLADARLLNASKNFSNENWQKHLKINHPDNGKSGLRIGPIASGDKVVAFDYILTKYSNVWTQLIGVEMEASGVARAAFESPHKPGFFMVRCVSDMADQNKDSSDVQVWRSYACHAAAKFTIEFLKSGPIPLAKQLSENNEPFLPINNRSSIPHKLDRKKPNSYDSESPEILMWLKTVGLKENPFRYLDAENDPNISSYFVNFPELVRITPRDLISDSKTWIFCGQSGSGKTALRRFIVSHGQPANPKADFLCIEYSHKEFMKLISETDHISEFRYSFIRSVIRTVTGGSSDVLLDESTGGTSVNRLEICLTRLSNVIKSRGFKKILCLMEPGAGKFSLEGIDLTSAFMICDLLSLLPIEEMSFCFFVSTEIKNELLDKCKALPKIQHKLVQIKWDERTLAKLIPERLRLVSHDQLYPYRSLEQLLEDENHFSRMIDTKILKEAQGNPREVILKANNFILQMHSMRIRSREFLLRKVRTALSNLPGRRGAILTFWGSKGIGKTNLLKMFSHELSGKNGIKLAEIWNIEALTLDQIKDIIDNSMAQTASNETFVVLIDNVDHLLRREWDGKSFFEFELNILTPLVIEKRLLILLTSQVELIQWRENDVRSRNVNHNIPTLTVDEIASMVHNTGLDAEKVYQLSFGQPQVVNWLKDQRSLSEKDLANRSWEYFLGELSEKACEIGEIICLLPVFNIFLLLSILNKDSLNDIQYLDCLEWVKEYIHCGLIHWDASIGLYRFTDSAVRRLLARSIRHEKPEKYKEIQQIAADYFLAESKSPAYLHMHLTSAIFHLAQTRHELFPAQIGAECLDWIRSNKDLWMNALWVEILKAWQSGAGESAVLMELRELIGDEYFSFITQEIETYMMEAKE